MHEISMNLPFGLIGDSIEKMHFLLGLPKVNLNAFGRNLHFANKKKLLQIEIAIPFKPIRIKGKETSKTNRIRSLYSLLNYMSKKL